MKIIADENIPEVTRLFGRFGEVRSVPAGAIDKCLVADADVLLVRSVTRVDAQLVEKSRVQFVGSATIGTDHVDQVALARLGITFAHAPGSNAESVVEYVTAALLELGDAGGHPVDRATLGIVGYGNTGRRLARRASAMGVRVLVNDPPREEAGERLQDLGDFRSLRETLTECDVASIHVPLVRTGAHCTVGLIGAPELALLRPGAALINTSRGPVVVGAALRETLEGGNELRAVLDVFENEPAPDPALIDRLFLATPHIAGYSYDGKLNGALMLRDALCEHLGIVDAVPRPGDGEEIWLPAPATTEKTPWLRAVVRQMYDIRADDRRLRAIQGLSDEDRAAGFTRLRKEYPRRRSFDHFRMTEESVPHSWRRAVQSGLQVRIGGGYEL